MNFVRWPSKSVTLQHKSAGIAPARYRSELLLPQAVLKQVSTVERAWSIPGVHAIWLSGSAARGQLRHSSDIDWVIVADVDVALDGWPTSRHSFQVYESEVFFRSLGDGHEFSVWQLAYGCPIYLTDAFLARLRDTRIARGSVAVQR